MSTLGATYQRLYDVTCGRHPNLRPWHFQWLGSKDLYRDLRRILPTLEGRIADIGCRDKPYSNWLNRAVIEYIGVDVEAGERVDVVLPREGKWPLPSEYFDAVICTQVLEHVRSAPEVIRELERILKPAGKVLVSLPFIYNAHGAPEDYRRLSADGLKEKFNDHFEVLELSRQGHIGSTLGLLLLNWLDHSFSLTLIGRFTKAGLLPLWLAFSATINLLAVLLDRLDYTESFYNNVLLLGVKRQ